MGGTVVGVIRGQVGNGQGEAVPEVDQLVPGVEVGPLGTLTTIGVQGHVGPFHLSHAGQEFGHLPNLGVDGVSPPCRSGFMASLPFMVMF